MRHALVSVLLVAAASTAGAQSVASSRSPDASRHLEFGPMIGWTSSGFVDTYPGSNISGQTGNRGHAIWGGAYARQPLARGLHAELQLAFEIKADNGANLSMPFLQLPLVVEYLPFAPRRGRAFVRPVLIAGASAGLRLGDGSVPDWWGRPRAGELSAVFGLGVEAHSKSTGWMQLAMRVQAGRSDLSAAPGRTTSNLLVFYIKAHPDARH